MRHLTSIVPLQAGSQIFRDSDIVALGIVYALQYVHIDHSDLGLACRAVARGERPAFAFQASARRRSPDEGDIDVQAVRRSVLRADGTSDDDAMRAWRCARSVRHRLARVVTGECG